MLAAFALIGGAIYLWRTGGESRHIILMLTAALVMVANAVIWSIPVR